LPNQPFETSDTIRAETAAESRERDQSASHNLCSALRRQLTHVRTSLPLIWGVFTAQQRMARCVVASLLDGEFRRVARVACRPRRGSRRHGAQTAAPVACCPRRGSRQTTADASRAP
jgi:hypothetical protein